MAGISYMIPAIILGGILLAFSIGLAKIIWGPEAGTDFGGKYGILNVLNFIGVAAFTLMIPILAGFIANSIGGRSAIVPAMVSAFLANDVDKIWKIPGIDADSMVPLGFIGALIAGLVVGYFVKWVLTWRVPKAIQAAMPIFFIPIVAGLGMSLIFIYAIGGPISWVMGKVSEAIQNAYTGEIGIGVGLGLGILLGAMAGFDMGGPINKIAFITAGIILVPQGIYEPMGSVAAAIPVAPIAMGLTTLIVKKSFNEEERGLGIAALIMGIIGISEGAIPFALRDPKRAVVSNVIGSAVAGGIAGALGVQDYAAHGGPIVAILGAVPYGLQTLYFFIAVIIGVIVTTSIYSSWLLADAGKFGSVKEFHVKTLANLKDETADKNEELKKQIEDLKTQRRIDVKEAKKAGKNPEHIEGSYLVKIEDLKSQIKKNKLDTKEEIHQLKAEYKKLSVEEKEAVNSRKVDIKEFKVAEHDKLDHDVTKLRKKLAKTKDIENKYQRKEKHNKIVEEIKETKTASKLSVNEFEAQIRKPFVDQYQAKLAKVVA